MRRASTNRSHVLAGISKPCNCRMTSSVPCSPRTCEPEATCCQRSSQFTNCDAVTGSIREGLDADFAVVNADLAHLPAEEICQSVVVQTWIRGQVAYQQH